MSERPQAVPKRLIENKRVAVTEWRFPPHGETGWHVHAMDYLVLPQTDGKLLLETKDGDRYAELRIGHPYFRHAGVEHNVVNANDFELVFIEVEVKSP
ncbi:MAG TPA: cupin domain-containing protein [Burkholderiales bacterium]|nr:cupin domain-containing protein [Burkholderiales bacterium]